MKIRIVAVGKVKESFILEGVREYMKRLAPLVKLEMVELKDEGMEKEAKVLERYLGDSTFILDVSGKRMSSEGFAKLVKDQEMLTFLIGGADGIDGNLKKRAKAISLSDMTFTHEMSRLFLMEQVYRAFMINTNRKYHR
jgi:23S rRNA (pseudouridine1915-N3)-methyltransferase